MSTEPPSGQRDSLLVVFALGVAGVALIVVLAAVAYLTLKDDDSPTATTPASASATSTTERDSGDDPKPAPPRTRATRVQRWRLFQTGADPGESLPAAICRAQPSRLYCWTPNDGYTIVLPAAAAPFRVPADESANRGNVPGGARLLPAGGRMSAGAFSCTNAGPLECESRSGHGWVLPRYRGLPELY
ncbi:MAG TPA: hypothetical protein VF549_10820 [Solirubrobacteraceae bacterium]|jgi:hypothetical protein